MAKPPFHFTLTTTPFYKNGSISRRVFSLCAVVGFEAFLRARACKHL
jgi:hypothetical protein